MYCFVMFIIKILHKDYPVFIEEKKTKNSIVIGAPDHKNSSPLILHF